MVSNEDREGPGVFHISEGDDPMLGGYVYSATGFGVRHDTIAAVLQAWASVSPDGDPATTLRSVNDGLINQVDSLARITAQGFLKFLVSHGWGPKPAVDAQRLNDLVTECTLEVALWPLIHYLESKGIEVSDD